MRVIDRHSLDDAFSQLAFTFVTFKLSKKLDEVEDFLPELDDTIYADGDNIVGQGTDDD